MHHAPRSPSKRRWPWILVGICVLLLTVGIVVSHPSAGPSSSAAPSPPRPPAAPLAAFGNGDYAIGTAAPGRPAILPGSYYTLGRLDDDRSCFWAREKDLSGAQESFIAYKLIDGPATVKILPSDAGFTTSGCIPWVRVGN